MSTTGSFLVKLKVIDNGKIKLEWICPYSDSDNTNENDINVENKIVLINNLMELKDTYGSNELLIMNYLRNLATPLFENNSYVNKEEDEEDEEEEEEEEEG